MNEKFMNVMLTVAAKIGNNRYLAAIRDAFTDLMPIIIVGSFCTLFSNVVCNTTPGYMSLANVPGGAIQAIICCGKLWNNEYDVYRCCYSSFC